MKTKTKDMTAGDRYALDHTTEITEALARMGKFAEAELRQMQADRAAVGAKPLDLAGVPGDEDDRLTPDRAPEAIRALREREGASRAVLARHFGTAVGTVGQWERGVRKPDGPALKLLSLAYRHGLEYIR